MINEMYEFATTLGETLIFAVIIIIHQITNFCISYHHAKSNRVTAKEWTAGDLAVSILDGTTSKICPIYPRTMLKMAIGSTIVLVVCLGKIILFSMRVYYVMKSNTY